MKRSQAGNAFIFILLAIALFAALAYTFIKGGRNSTGQMNTQQAKMAASEILAYSNILSKTIDKLRTRGCSEKELSFEVSVGDGYQNPSARGDNSCNVFNANGGQLTLQTLPANSSINGTYLFSGEQCIAFVGDGDYYCEDPPIANYQKNLELMMIATKLKRNVCEQINTSLGIPNNGPNGPPNEQYGGYNADKYIGVFGGSGYPLEMNAATSGKWLQACVYSSDTGGNLDDDNTYFFYSVLITR